MVSYRGAYMMALGMIIHDGLNQKTVFLWTLPMFHCNGRTLIRKVILLRVLMFLFCRLGISMVNCGCWRNTDHVK